MANEFLKKKWRHTFYAHDVNKDNRITVEDADIFSGNFARSCKFNEEKTEKIKADARMVWKEWALKGRGLFGNIFKVIFRGNKMESKYSFDNVCYKEIKNPDTYSSYSVNCVTTGPLPSYIRTLSPTCQTTHGNTESDNGVCKRANFRCNLVCLLLLLTFLLVSSVAVYAVLSNVESKTSEDVINHNEQNATSNWIGTYKVTLNLTDSGYKIYSKGRTPCATRCIPYEHAKFKSKCENRYCVCNGQNYQRTTCLPMIDGCTIKKQIAETYLDNSPVSSYTCHVPASTNTHVISVYGNHFSRQTVVNLSGSSVGGATVILASHYSVRWKLKCTGVNLKRVVLVSDRHHGSRGLDMDCDTNNLDIPAISSLRIPFGYGDDRYGMDTVNMIKVIRNTFGNVKSFIGAEFADYINVKI